MIHNLGASKSELRIITATFMMGDTTVVHFGVMLAVGKEYTNSSKQPGKCTETLFRTRIGMPQQIATHYGGEVFLQEHLL